MGTTNIGERLNEIIAQAKDDNLHVESYKQDIVVTLNLGERTYLTAIYYSAKGTSGVPDAVSLSCNDQEIDLSPVEVSALSRYL